MALEFRGCWRAALQVAAFAWLAGACQSGGGEGGPGGRGGEGGGRTGGAGGTAGATAGQGGGGAGGGSSGGAGGSAPQKVTFGLDSLPANTTCVAIAKLTDNIPDKLSATGCMQAQDPREPAPGVVPYGVASPLWSDDATKRRFVALPKGKSIKILANGDWELPIGTTLIKSFELGGSMLETRFFVRLADGSWLGYTYQWAEDGKDATLLGKAGGDRFIGDVDWVFPSRDNCLGCHTAAAGRSLGLETAQLNSDFVYPGNKQANQIATLDHLGLFESSPGDPAKLPSLPNPVTSESASKEARARSYLHANCAFCHQPDAAAEVFKDMPVAMDLRYATPFAGTKTCNVVPSKTTYSIPDAKLVSPGKPDASILSVRMHSTITSVRMPAFGTSVVDDKGVAAVDDWIRSLTGCP
jgi:uncharacterized repeat protein (TIGR03806 family)